MNQKESWRVCEYHGGPKDGGTMELHKVCAVGFVHGVMMAHSPCYHPFVDPSAIVDSRPALVVLYRLTGISPRGEGYLDFVGYA